MSETVISPQERADVTSIVKDYEDLKDVEQAFIQGVIIGMAKNNTSDEKATLLQQ